MIYFLIILRSEAKKLIELDTCIFKMIDADEKDCKNAEFIKM